MAEELDWDMEAFDKAFLEVSDHGMAKADFKARLVWLPNALKHNKPESPNVVRSWRVEMDLLPECDLKNEAIERIREYLETIGPSYVSAFDEVVSAHAKKPSTKPLAKPSKKAMPNQEQEQEQEQEQYLKPFCHEPETGSPATAKKPKPEFDFLLGKFTGLPDSLIAGWAGAYPAVNVQQEIAKAAAWLMSNTKNKKSDYPRFLNNWLSRAQDSARSVQGQHRQEKFDPVAYVNRNRISKQRTYHDNVNPFGNIIEHESK